MGYDPKKYSELFPKGLFEFQNKPIKTWFDSHKLFALNTTPLEEKEETIAPGLKRVQGSLKQKNGFSNFMIFETDLTKRKVEIEFFKSNMLYPLEAFKKLNNPKLLTNGGYFYLTDDESRDPVAAPQVRTGNLVVQKGKLVNLPILDRSAIVIKKDGTVNIKFLKAKGKVLLNNRRLNWVGSKTDYPVKDSLVVYNSSNIEIPVVEDPVMGPSRMAQVTDVDPEIGRKLLVCKKENNFFKVVKVKNFKVMINDKDMVVSVPDTLEVEVGDRLEFKSIDNLKLKDVKTAVSTGPTMFKSLSKTQKQVEKEFSVPDMANPNNPHDEAKKLARGALVKLNDTKVASILIDGIPQAGDIYPGVTLSEFVKFIKSKYPSFKSAIATDPSSSVKVIYKDKKDISVFGNLHYLAHKKDKNGNIEFWPNGKLGRKLNSALVVY